MRWIQIAQILGVEIIFTTKLHLSLRNLHSLPKKVKMIECVEGDIPYMIDVVAVTCHLSSLYDAI